MSKSRPLFLCIIEFIVHSTRHYIVPIIMLSRAKNSPNLVCFDLISHCRTLIKQTHKQGVLFFLKLLDTVYHEYSMSVVFFRVYVGRNCT